MLARCTSLLASPVEATGGKDIIIERRVVVRPMQRFLPITDHGLLLERF